MGIRINNIEDFIEEVDTKSIFEELLDDEDDYEDEYYRRERKARYKSEIDLAHELEGIPVEKKSSRKTRIVDLSDNIFEVNKYDRGLIFGNETVVTTRRKNHEKFNSKKSKEDNDDNKNQSYDKEFTLDDLDFEVVSLLDKANKHVPRYERKLEKKKKYIEERRNSEKKPDKENVRLKSIFDKLDDGGEYRLSGLNREFNKSIAPALDLSFLRFDNLTAEESHAVESMFKWISESISDETIPDSIRQTVGKTIISFTKSASKNNFLSWMQIIHSISSTIAKTMGGMKLLIMVCGKLAEYCSTYIFASRPAVICRNMDDFDKDRRYSYFNEESFNELTNYMYEILY